MFISRHEQRKNDLGNRHPSPYVNNPTVEYYQKSPSAFCTPVSPQQSNSNNTFAWPFSTNQNQKVFLLILFFVYLLF